MIFQHFSIVWNISRELMKIESVYFVEKKVIKNLTNNFIFLYLDTVKFEDVIQIWLIS